MKTFCILRFGFYNFYVNGHLFAMWPEGNYTWAQANEYVEGLKKRFPER